MGDAGGLAGYPAGSRRRRLTLAPRPSAAVGHEREKRGFKVRDVVFADSDGSDVEKETVTGQDWPEFACDSSVADQEQKPYFGSASDPLLGARKAGTSSRFWPLTDEGSSDEDFEFESLNISMAKVDSDAEKLQVKSTNSPTAKADSDYQSLQDTSLVDVDAESHNGKGSRCANSVSSSFSSTNSVLVKRAVTKTKLWRGPLPKRRASPKLSLGDILVRDVRSARTNGQLRLKSFAETGELKTMADGEVPTEDLPDPVESEKIVTHEEHSFQSQGPIIWVGNTGFVRVGVNSVFRCADGLGQLFKGGGKPKSLTSHRSPIRRGSRLVTDRSGDDVMRRGVGGHGAVGVRVNHVMKVIAWDSEQKMDVGKRKLVDVLTEEADAGEGVEGDVLGSGIKWARCTKKGHVAARCADVIYCVICDLDDMVMTKGYKDLGSMSEKEEEVDVLKELARDRKCNMGKPEHMKGAASKGIKAGERRQEVQECSKKTT